jgi:hypothetical protein
MCMHHGTITTLDPCKLNHINESFFLLFSKIPLLLLMDLNIIKFCASYY